MQVESAIRQDGGGDSSSSKLNDVSKHSKAHLPGTSGEGESASANVTGSNPRMFLFYFLFNFLVTNHLMSLQYAAAACTLIAKLM